MAKKVPFYTLWEFKSLPWIIIVSLTCIFLVFFPIIKDSYNERRLSELDGVTKAFVVDIEEQKILRQGLEGNEIRLASYFVTYEYFVNDILYVNAETIGSVKWKNHLKVNETDTLNDPFSVRFDPEKPSRALLELKHFGK